jgi:hypothetical protein
MNTNRRAFLRGDPESSLAHASQHAAPTTRKTSAQTLITAAHGSRIYHRPSSHSYAYLPMVFALPNRTVETSTPDRKGNLS